MGRRMQPWTRMSTRTARVTRTTPGRRQEGDRELRDRVDELLLDLKQEDPTTDERERWEQERLQERDCRRWYTGERDRPRESVYNKNMAGEHPWSEECTEEALNLDGTKSKGERYSLWTEVVQLKAEEESKRERLLNSRQEEDEGGWESREAVHKLTGDGERAEPDWAGEVGWVKDKR